MFEQQSQHESQRAAIASIAGKMGCTPETLRKWVLATTPIQAAVG